MKLSFPEFNRNNRFRLDLRLKMVSIENILLNKDGRKYEEIQKASSSQKECFYGKILSVSKWVSQKLSVEYRYFEDRKELSWIEKESICFDQSICWET